VLITVVVLISFLCYCGDYAGYITVILPILAFHLCSTSFYIWYIASGINTLSLAEIVEFFFSRVKMYSDVFKPQRSVVTHINLWLRDSYMPEIQVVLKPTFVGHPCNPCWYPFEW
jgi:hypothetical protein